MESPHKNYNDFSRNNRNSYENITTRKENRNNNSNNNNKGKVGNSESSLEKQKDITSHRKDVYKIDDSMIKNLSGNGISKENNIKIRSHHGPTTNKFIDYIKPSVRKKPDVVVIHTGTNDLTNKINTYKKNQKIIQCSTRIRHR